MGLFSRIKRKSMMSQIQGQLQGAQEQVKDQAGTIETLERQLVQAGIKGKVMRAEMEIDKKKNQTNSRTEKEYLETQAKQKLARSMINESTNSSKKQLQDDRKIKGKEMDLQIRTAINTLQGKEKNT